MIHNAVEVLTIIVSLVGGSTGGAALGGWQAARIRGMTLRGRARLVHEDLYRLQSTVTRLYYQTPTEKQWGSSAWLLDELAAKEDQQDVVAHLRTRTDFTNCAGALGWSDYLRSSYGKGDAPLDAELVSIYERLDCGRRAVARLAHLHYEAHHPENVVKPPTRVRNAEVALSEATATPSAYEDD
jgi:hypothetical protein